MKLILAPLRGHTDFVFRNALSRHFSGLDAQFAPFITTVKGKAVRDSHIRDLLPKYNKSHCLVPQLIGKDADEFVVHAHICRGVEVIHGCPVYHGLGNFVTVTGALLTDQSHPERKAWAKKRKQMFGFAPDPRFPFYPFIRSRATRSSPSATSTNRVSFAPDSFLLDQRGQPARGPRPR